MPVAGDIATTAGVGTLWSRQRERQFGGADILIGNAGTGSSETIMEAADEKWQAYWELHVMAAVRLARGFVPMMRTRGGGVILHNASICAVQPLYYEPIYNVTKAALMMFSKNLAVEVIKDNIRVNTINPGLILTEGWMEPVKRITADSGGDWQGYLQIRRRRARADQALRHGRGTGEFLRVPVLGARQLLGWLGLFRRRRLAAHRLTIGRQPGNGDGHGRRHWPRENVNPAHLSKTEEQSAGCKNEIC